MGKENLSRLRRLRNVGLAIPVVVALSACGGGEEKSVVSSDNPAGPAILGITPTPENQPNIVPSKEVTPQDRIASYAKEVLKPDLIPPELSAPKEGNVSIFGEQFKTYTSTIDSHGSRNEFIYTESMSGAPIDVAVIRTFSNANVPFTRPDFQLEAIKSFFNVASNVAPESLITKGKEVNAQIYETSWDNPDGTKDTRAVQYGLVASNGVGGYSVVACKLYKDNPLYQYGTCFIAGAPTNRN